jgi:hypothetical protein
MSAEQARIKALEREIRELRQTNEIPGLRRGSSVQDVGLFCDGGAQPPLQAMIAFIDAHREVYGVEPICRVLPIAPSTYHEHTARWRDPARRPTRARRDGLLRTEIRRVWKENFRVYGVRKIWRQLRREGVTVARCTTARLMRFSGALRSKPVKTTLGNPAAPCPPDQVNRQFRLLYICQRIGDPQGSAY